MSITDLEAIRIGYERGVAFWDYLLLECGESVAKKTWANALDDDLVCNMLRRGIDNDNSYSFADTKRDTASLLKLAGDKRAKR